MTNEAMFTNLSDAQIEDALKQYAKLPSVVTLLGGIKVAREASRKQALEELSRQANLEKGKQEFGEKLSKMGKLPAPPEGIYNVYMVWREEEEPQGEPEEVEVVKPDGSKVKEMRQATIKVNKWVVETNKGFQVSKSGTSTSGQSGTTKRAITVYHRNGTNLEAKGNFRSGAEACKHLGVIVGSDSANRALARDGYIAEPYTGTDFTVAQ